MIACEACGTPLLTTGRDCCHLLSLSPHRDTVCVALSGLQPSWSSSSPISKLLEDSLCPPAMTGATEAIHSQSASQTEHLCPVQVPTQRRVFLNPLQSPKSCISTGAASRQPRSCGLPWGGWENTLRLFCPLFQVNREDLQSVNLWFFIFLPFLSLRAFGKGEVGTSQHELTHLCPDRLLITGAVSSISVKTSTL